MSEKVKISVMRVEKMLHERDGFRCKNMFG